MNAYQYKISLRVRHPSMDPNTITSALGRVPFRHWRAGDASSTPRGTPLEGINCETYWTARVGEGEWPGKNLVAAVRELLQQLSAHRAFFQQVRAEGGSVEFFVGWYFDGNSGDVFDAQLLKQMGDLEIDLSLDVYPPAAG